MSVKQLNTTDIDEVQSPDPTMIISQGQGIVSQIDHPSGDLSGTAIAEISSVGSENKVYLVNNNFTFFSLLENQTVQVEPSKPQWDLVFTTFTNTVGPQLLITIPILS